MEPHDMALEPDEIRAIREGLGLSQADAGELLGGGPRAFTKYEAGTIRPQNLRGQAVCACSKPTRMLFLP